jgi:spore maturation protein CgeB
MKILLFYHTLVSDWNHGNAHFLRGVAGELVARGHQVEVWEPEDAWSRRNLLSEYGEKPIRKFRAIYPELQGRYYDRATFDPETALEGADLVIVHEWNDHEIVRKIGAHRAAGANYKLLFHDTHHRMVSDPAGMAAYDLSAYDGVLAFGEVLSRMYRERRPELPVWTWHEAADTRVFKPMPAEKPAGDLVWIGNWGDDERRAELKEFLIDPVADLHLKAKVHGVRYPADALEQLQQAGIEYGGWLPNFEAPRVFGEYKFAIHVPRRPYAAMLPGIPTIRVFEALASGIPLISAPWQDAEDLFTPGEDFLVAKNGAEMRAQMRRLLAEPDFARALAARGLRTIQQRHTCGHRVNQLLSICEQLQKP